MFDRYEGELVTKESLEQRILAFLAPTRTESVVYYEQDVDARPLLAYLERVNAGRKPEERITLFQVVLATYVRTMKIRNKMNRFALGGRVYQRRFIECSFIVKKDTHDQGKASAVKARFEPDSTLDEVIARIQQTVQRGRSHSRTASEREMSFGLKFPPVLLRVGVRFLQALDYFNLMPSSMIDADELYTSIFVANLGSVGLKAPFHHLYEWGTASIFCVVGQVEKKAIVNERGEIEVREMLPLRWTYDERIADGFYAARTLDYIAELLMNPSALERPPVEEVGALHPHLADVPKIAVL